MAPRNHISGTRPAGYEPGDSEILRIPYGATPEDHADVRRKLAAGWKLGEVCGEADSIFKYAYIYPPTAAGGESAPTDGGGAANPYPAHEVPASDPDVPAPEVPATLTGRLRTGWHRFMHKV